MKIELYSLLSYFCITDELWRVNPWSTKPPQRISDVEHFLNLYAVFCIENGLLLDASDIFMVLYQCSMVVEPANSDVSYRYCFQFVSVSISLGQRHKSWLIFRCLELGGVYTTDLFWESLVKSFSSPYYAISEDIKFVQNHLFYSSSSSSSFIHQSINQ